MIALKNEYIRTALLGNNKKRRSLATLTALLKQKAGKDFERLQQELDSLVKDLKQLLVRAEEIAQLGLTEDSLEYDQLERKVRSITAFDAFSIVRSRYLEAKQGSSQKKENEPEVVNDEDETPASPASLSELASLAAAITNNSGKEERDTVKNCVTTFPAHWKSPKYQSQYVPENAGECMYQYCHFGLKDDKKYRTDEQRKMLRLYSEFEKDAAKKEADTALAESWLKDARKLAEQIKKKPEDPEIKRKIRQCGGPLPDNIARYFKKKKELEEHQKVLRKHHVKINVPTTKEAISKKTQDKIQAYSHTNYQMPQYIRHQNDIFTLTPAKKWNLYIDESGKEENFVIGGSGVMAAVLENADCPLPNFQPLHASSDSTEELISEGDKVIETLLNHPQAGVLAIPVRVYRAGENWGSLIVSCIDLVLRLLPVAGEKTEVKIYVEARSPYVTEDDFRMMQDACRYQLMHTLPERAKLIRFEICPMDKTHPKNAYPDLVANTCFSHAPVPRTRFSISNWDKTCFLNYDAMQLCNLLDFFYLGKTLSLTDWNELVQSADLQSQSLVSALLQSFGEELRRDQDLWCSFLNYFVEHLNSKAINLYKLGKQLNYLKRYQPVDGQLPPRIRLLWLTAKLAEANHRGAIEIESMDDFYHLIEALYEEDAPLTCWATLHLAVNFTNSFEFQKASSVVENYLNLLTKTTWGKNQPAWVHSVFDSLVARLDVEPYSPAAIPGLQYYAQLISSHGQHEAFLGNNDRAIPFFTEANRQFAKLSTGGKLDILQTSAYLLTSLMDSEHPDPQLVAQTLEEYFGKDLVATAETLAVGNEAADKYRHHILLRYIHSGKAPDSLRDAVLARKDQWIYAEGHPWEMIEFYRALLVANPQERIDHLKKAHELSQGYDATLHVIDAVILGSLLLDDPSVCKEYETLVEKCAVELPALGKRIEILKEQPIQKRSPLELAALVLPFNFR